MPNPIFFGQNHLASIPEELEINLLADLISYWSLDETSGTRVDSHGNNDLTDNNTVTYSTGKISNATQMAPANSEYLSSTSSELDIGGGDAAWSCWVYFDNAAPYRAILGKYGATLGELGFLLWYYDTAPYGIMISASDDGTNYVECPTAFYVDNATWYHIYAQYNRSTKKVGLSVNNGTLIESSALSTAGIYVSNVPFVLGGEQGGVNYMSGRIDEVGFWHRLLTADERTALYNLGSGFPYGSFT